MKYTLRLMKFDETVGFTPFQIPPRSPVDMGGVGIRPTFIKDVEFEVSSSFLPGDAINYTDNQYIVERRVVTIAPDGKDEMLMICIPTKESFREPTKAEYEAAENFRRKLEMAAQNRIVAPAFGK